MFLNLAIKHSVLVFVGFLFQETVPAMVNEDGVVAEKAGIFYIYNIIYNNYYYYK